MIGRCKVCGNSHVIGIKQLPPDLCAWCAHAPWGICPGCSANAPLFACSADDKPHCQACNLKAKKCVLIPEALIALEASKRKRSLFYGLP